MKVLVLKKPWPVDFREGFVGGEIFHSYKSISDCRYQVIYNDKIFFMHENQVEEVELPNLVFMTKDCKNIAQTIGDLIKQEKERKDMNKHLTKTWIVGSINQRGHWNISSNPVEHKTEYLASQEAERLAKNDQSKKFVVLEVVGKVQAAQVTWEK